MVIESGFQVDLPPGKHFRFSELRAYQSPLKGCCVSEMDFGYWDEKLGALCFLELKDLSPTNPKAVEAARQKSKETRANELLELGPTIRGNIKDTLVMMHAAWNQHGHGKALAAELPAVCRERAPLRLLFVLKLPAPTPKELRSLLSPQGVAQSAARGYAALLGLEVTAAVLDQRQAERYGLPLALMDEGTAPAPP